MLPKRKKIKWTKSSPEIEMHAFNRDFLWESSNGALVRLMDLNTNHIKNIIKKSYKIEGYIQDKTLNCMRMELVYRELYNIK